MLSTLKPLRPKLQIKTDNPWLQKEYEVLGGIDFTGTGDYQFPNRKYIIVRSPKTSEWPAFDVMMRIDIVDLTASFVDINSGVYMDENDLLAFGDFKRGDEWITRAGEPCLKVDEIDIGQWIHGKVFEV